MKKTAEEKIDVCNYERECKEVGWANGHAIKWQCSDRVTIKRSKGWTSTAPHTIVIQGDPKSSRAEAMISLQNCIEDFELALNEIRKKNPEQE